MTRWFSGVFAGCGLLLLAACSSTPEPPPGQPQQAETQTLNRSAALAYQQGHYPQAVTLYSVALDQALSEDDPLAITDARFNLALTLMAQGDYQAALDQVVQAEGERERRGLPSDPQLRLLAAAVRYRQGEPGLAEQLLEPLLAGPVETATRQRAVFILGLIDAGQGDAASLRVRIAGLQDAALDRMELQARLAAIEGDTGTALGLLDQVIARRGEQRDFRGMSRALAAAGTLAEQVGRNRLAADYLLRAGRSAAQRQAVDAAEWLQRAIRLGESAGDRALVLEAESVLATLQP